MLLPEFIGLTSDLIRFRSTAANPKDILACCDFLAQWLRANEIAYQRLEDNGVPSLVICGSAMKAPVTLLCHFDVVDGPGSAFIPDVRDGKLYGRGSSDDKYACAIALLLYRDHLRELRAAGGSQDDMPFMVALTGDEEIGGKHGARFLADRVNTEFCIALDSGPHGVLTVKQKGYLRLSLVCKGVAAHGAYPWKGENAALALARDCLAIEAFFAGQKGANEEDECDHWYPTCNVGVMRAGTTVNQVPDSAQADLDVRYTERDNPDALIRAMQAVISGTLTETQDRGLPVAAGDSPWIDQLIRHIPGVVCKGFSHGACDTRHFSHLGIPCVAWGADSENTQHMDNEHLVLDSAGIVYHSLDAFLRSIRK